MALVLVPTAGIKPGDGLVHRATSALLRGPIPRDDVLAIARALSLHTSLATFPRACVAYSYGSEPRAVFRELRTRVGLRVLWQGTIAPLWLRPLAGVFAGQGGLIEIGDGAQLPSLVDSLSVLAMVEVYSFSADRLPAVTSHVRANGWRSFVGRLIGEDPAYFCFGVTGDAPDVPTGHYAWTSYGDRCPEDLRGAVAPWCTTQSA